MAATSGHRPPHVPPKYSPGEDGLWRRAPSYTLVGSTVCDTCATPTVTTAPNEDEILSNVPAGWVRTPVSSPMRTRITIALSVTLAVFIFLTLLRFHFQPRKGKTGDPEKKRTKTVVPVEKEKEMAMAMTNTKRKWRWRENPRIPRRIFRRPKAISSTATLVSSRPPSPAPSTTASLASTAVTSILTSPSQTSLPPEPEPPAYPPSSKLLSATPMLHSGDTELDADVDPTDEAYPPYTPRIEEGEFDWGSSPGAGTSGAGSSAHVATDDKALLQRLAESASEPDAAEGSTPTQSQFTIAQAPEEDVLDLDVDLLPVPLSSLSTVSTLTLPTIPIPLSHPHSNSNSLPSPPPPPSPQPLALTPEKMALERAFAAAPTYPSAPAYQQYSCAEAGPSSPRASVSIGPSAPPLCPDDDEEREGEFEVEGEGNASAPPLWDFDDDEEPNEREPQPSSPPHDSGDSHVDPHPSSRPDADSSIPDPDESPKHKLRPGGGGIG